MGSGQSTDNATNTNASITTVTIEKSLVDKHLAELVEVKSKLLTVEEENKESKRLLGITASNNISLPDAISKNENKIHELQDEIRNINAKLANQTISYQQLQESEKSLQQRNKDVWQENSQIKLQLVDVEINKDRLQTFNQVLTNERATLELELNQFKAHKSALELIVTEKESLIHDKDVLYENLVEENRRDKNKIQAVENDNLRLHDLVSEKEIAILNLQDEMENIMVEFAKRDELVEQSQKSEKSVLEKNVLIRRRLVDLEKERDNLQNLNRKDIGERNAVELKLKRCEAHKRSLEITITENESLIKDKDVLYQKLEKENRCSENKIQAMEVDVLRLREAVSEKESDVCKLRNEVQKKNVELSKQTELCKQLGESEKSLQRENDKIRSRVSDIDHLGYLNKSLQQNNSDLRKENNKVRKCLSDAEKERNDLQKRIETLTSDPHKLQSELERYNATNLVTRSVDIRNELQKITVEIDQVKSRAVNEMKNPARISKESKLKKIESEYNRNAERLRKFNFAISNENFNSAVNNYRSVYEENEANIGTFMKKLYDIEVFCKHLSELLNMNIVRIDDEMPPALTAKFKEFDELKRTPFVDDFQREKSLYTDILKVNSDVKTILEKISKDASDDRQNWNIIIYNFKENSDVQADLTNVKYFLGRLGLESSAIHIRRMHSALRKYQTRPVIVKLPSPEALNFVLSCENKLKEIRMSYVKIEKFHGEVE